MKKLFFLVFSVACLSACAYSTRVPYQVNSATPGAQIYVDGVSMGIAPVQVELACDKIWRCPADGSCSWEYSGYEYKVTAYPSERSSDMSQTKLVNPCGLKEASGQIHFAAWSDSVASQPTDVNQNDKTITVDNSGNKVVLH